MWIVELLAAALGDVLEGVLADVLGVEADDDDELDEHPPINAAITDTAAAHATIRARSGLDMVPNCSFREKGAANRSTLIFAPGSG